MAHEGTRGATPAYDALYDTCRVQGWDITLLARKDRPYCVEVHADGKRIASATRQRIEDAAKMCTRTLERSGRLRSH